MKLTGVLNNVFVAILVCSDSKTLKEAVFASLEKLQFSAGLIPHMQFVLVCCHCVCIKSKKQRKVKMRDSSFSAI